MQSLTVPVDLPSSVQSRFDLLQLRTGQREILHKLAQRQDVLGVLPTGYGKSLCYELPPLLWGWQIVVVSPLLSLMEDQANRMKRHGLRVELLHSGKSKLEIRKTMNSIKGGGWDIVLLSPERLGHWIRSGWVPQLLGGVDYFVFDEVHCFFEWSQFRPAYNFISRWLSRNPVKVLALSATVHRSQEQALMGIWERPLTVVRMPLGRERLFLQCIPCESFGARYEQLFAALAGTENPTGVQLVYCYSRRETERVAHVLQSAFHGVESFHAGQTPANRTQTLDRLFAGALQIVCATSAFGMGVDYPNIRRVIHWGPPASMAAYWQEVGRSGRDGNDSVAVLLWNRSDVLRLQQNHKKDSEAVAVESKNSFTKMWRFLSSTLCRKQLLASHFGEECVRCRNCDNCRRRGHVQPHGERDKIRLRNRIPWWATEDTQEFFLQQFLG